MLKLHQPSEEEVTSVQIGRATMESDEDKQLILNNTRQYNALRADLSAALSAFDRAQDWAVS